MTNVSVAVHHLVDVFNCVDTTYAVIGGIAVGVYGIPQSTNEVDVMLSLPRERLPELLNDVQQRGFLVPEQNQKGCVDTVAKMPGVKLRFHLNDRGVDADIFLAETPFQREIMKRRQLVETTDGTLWLASPEDIIILKLLANRTRDRSDAQDILFTQGELDEPYMRKWAEELGVLALLEKTLADARSSEEF